MKTAAVLQLDPDLATGLSGSRRARAARDCLAAVVEIPKGEWQAELADFNGSGFGLLVLSGVLCRRVVQRECFGAELIGPGDLMRPWDNPGEWSSIPAESRWLAIQPSRVAVLDASFARRARAYPEVASDLLRRALLRSRYLATLVAIISQRRIETRLTMLFWHLADRFGRVHGEWVEIPVPLTHGILAELTAARRPSVTTALSHLQERGILVRERDSWRLSGTVPPELLEVNDAGEADSASLAQNEPASDGSLAGASSRP